MNVKNEILEELQEMRSSLAGAPRAMPFPVPKGYFELLADETLNSIKDEASNWVKDNAYTQPKGYFEQLPQDIIAEIHIEETVQTFSKIEVYSAPLNYFDALPQQILSQAKATEHKPAQRTIVIKWQQAAKWCAAAVMVMGLALGSYKFLSPKALDTSSALAALPVDSIHAYIVQNVDDFDTELILNNLSADKPVKATGQFNEQEIIQYLNEDGWNTKTELN